jgi:hypothetical protein
LDHFELLLDCRRKTGRRTCERIQFCAGESRGNQTKEDDDPSVDFPLFYGIILPNEVSSLSITMEVDCSRVINRSRSISKPSVTAPPKIMCQFDEEWEDD